MAIVTQQYVSTNQNTAAMALQLQEQRNKEGALHL